MQSSSTIPKSDSTAKEGVHDVGGKARTNLADPTAPETKSGVQVVPSKGKSGWSGVITWTLICAAAGAGWYYRAAWLPPIEALLVGKQEGPTKPPPRPVPVVTAQSSKRDVDLYLNGLGTVTALQTVTVRSRVEGELIKVNFTEGQVVKTGELLAEIDPRPFQVQLQQAEAALARDQATLHAAERTLERLEQLRPTRTITQQELDDQIALVDQTRATIKSDQAAVENAKLQLDYCKIAAPFEGRIGLRLVDPGNMVRANDVSGIAVITQVQPITVVFTIPQDEIYRVRKRMKVGEELTVEAYDRDFQTRLATGKLMATDNQVDPTTGTLRLKALFEYSENQLFPNQFVNTRLLVETRKQSVVVPSAAVQRGPSFNYVYVARDDDTVERREVTLGPAEAGETIIESGLAEAETVVTDGIDKLQPGSAIVTRETGEKQVKTAASSEHPTGASRAAKDTP